MHRSSLATAERHPVAVDEGVRAYTTAALTELALHACLVARDSAFNVANLLSAASGMAVVVVKECEQDLDRYERLIDEQVPIAITQVDEAHARQLLTCLKFITDLERIGDLMLSVAQSAQRCYPKLGRNEARPLARMARAVERMLETTHRAFLSRDPRRAEEVIVADRQIDDLRRRFFRKYLEQRSDETSRTVNLLFMAQALERAGDHATNLGEELLHLFEGRSWRHASRERRSRANLSER